MTSILSTRPRARVLMLAAALGLVLLLVSPLFGRADVVGSYRPLLSPDGLTNGCYPLPGDVRLDFPYVLRRDGNVVAAHGLRRQVVVHFDRVDAAEATERATALFREAGVLDEVRIEAHDFADVPDDFVIRGQMVLDLPPTGVRSDDLVCQDVYSTKRFTPDLADRS